MLEWLGQWDQCLPKQRRIHVMHASMMWAWIFIFALPASQFIVKSKQGRWSTWKASRDSGGLHNYKFHSLVSRKLNQSQTLLPWVCHSATITVIVEVLQETVHSCWLICTIWVISEPCKEKSWKTCHWCELVLPHKPYKGVLLCLSIRKYYWTSKMCQGARDREAQCAIQQQHFYNECFY